MPRKRKSNLWTYLDGTGALERGNENEIRLAKKAYWKQYFSEYKKKQRAKCPEYTITFSKDKPDHELISHAAKKHKRTVTAFIRLATLAYINKTFVVPDPIKVARLEQILSDCLNEIKTIVNSKERYFWEKEQRLDLIEKRIIALEWHINDIFRNPTILNFNDHKNQVT